MTQQRVVNFLLQIVLGFLDKIFNWAMQDFGYTNSGDFNPFYPNRFTTTTYLSEGSMRYFKYIATTDNSQWQAGDLIHYPGHIGIYIGSGLSIYNSQSNASGFLLAKNANSVGTIEKVTRLVKLHV